MVSCNLSNVWDFAVLNILICVVCITIYPNTILSSAGKALGRRISQMDAYNVDTMLHINDSVQGRHASCVTKVGNEYSLMMNRD